MCLFLQEGHSTRLVECFIANRSITRGDLLFYIKPAVRSKRETYNYRMLHGHAYHISAAQRNDAGDRVDNLHFYFVEYSAFSRTYASKYRRGAWLERVSAYYMRMPSYSP